MLRHSYQGPCCWEIFGEYTCQAMRRSLCASVTRDFWYLLIKRSSYSPLHHSSHASSLYSAGLNRRSLSTFSKALPKMSVSKGDMNFDPYKDIQSLDGQVIFITGGKDEVHLAPSVPHTDFDRDRWYRSIDLEIPRCSQPIPHLLYRTEHASERNPHQFPQ